MGPMALTSRPPEGLAFGRFLVLPQHRELLADGQAVSLGGRAFDLLMALIEARGAVVTRDALMARVWPDRVVGENALQVQISALRGALGAERELIRTVSGRGYQFTGEISTQSAGRAERAGPATVAVDLGSAKTPTNLTEPVSALIGRDDELREVVSLAVRYRFVTLTGPGGIGKTRLALAVAHELRGEFTDGVWLAELAPLSDASLVSATVATATGVDLGVGAATPEFVANALTGKRLLLVLDNCEHVIDAAALLAETLVRANPTMHVIATSREPLNGEGEHLFPVSALAVPAEDAEEGDDLQRYGAVRLFLDRAREANSRFAPDRDAVAFIAGICRRLDGIPLAIELAAARATALGVEEVAARLDDRFHLLTGGRRTALPRHRTLRAMLDWSFDLLPERERVVLRRLSVFAGAFTLAAARAVAANAELRSSDVVEDVANLVAKSLVSAHVGVTGAHYRLLDTTRAYAREKLTESGEFQVIARRHAKFFRDFFDRLESEQATRPMPERLLDYGRDVNDVRAALDWTFSPAGDAALGVALTVASERLWFGLSLMDECRRRVEGALSSLRADMSRDARLEMQLSAALGAALYYAIGPCPEACAAWTDTLTLAERLDDREYRLRALWGLQSHHAGNGQLRVALTFAERLANLPSDQAGPTDLLVGERLLGSTLHFLGDLSNARRHLEQVLSRYQAPLAESDPDAIRFEWDRRSSARGSLIPVLWLQGFPDQATHMAQAYVAEAQATGHPVSLCWALYAACPIALAVGDFVAGERYVTMLLEQSAKHAPGFLRALAHVFQGELLIKSGDAVGGVRCLRSALDKLGATRFALRRPAILGSLAQGLATAGNVAEGLLTIQEAVAQCERTDELWNIAELLRLKGELLLLEGTEKVPTTAETLLLQALDWARRQGALSWELRCGISLARLLQEQGRIGEAHELLSEVYGCFTEGFDTVDLKNAKSLLASLSGSDRQPSER